MHCVDIFSHRFSPIDTDAGTRSVEISVHPWLLFSDHCASRVCNNCLNYMRFVEKFALLQSVGYLKIVKVHFRWM